MRTRGAVAATVAAAEPGETIGDEDRLTAEDAVERRPPLWWVLMRHEWRLTARSFFPGRAHLRETRTGASRPVGSVRGKSTIVVWIVAVVLIHALAVVVTLLLPRHLADDPNTRLIAVLALGFLFTLMLSSAMSRVVAAFHERRDLELLLAAPVAPSLILMTRSLTVAAAVALTFTIFIYPFADAGVVLGRWWTGRLYPLVPLMALLATAVALTLTGALVRLIGVRRARVGLQIFSAIVGASFYMLSQARRLLPGDSRRWMTEHLARYTQEGHRIWPVVFAERIAFGDAMTWLVFAVACVALFAASVRLASRRFADVAQMPEADSRVTVATRSAVDGRIASGFARGLFATLLVKEWRLIARSPQLISQILLQLLYLIPLMFVAFGGSHGRQGGIEWSAAAFAAGIVGVTSTLATSLAWLTVSAEDAPDLLAGSPTRPSVIVTVKFAAAALPPIALLALASAGVARRSVVDALIILVLGLLACFGAAILQAASPATGKRSDFQRRHRGRRFMVLVEMLQFLVWAAAAGLAVQRLWIAASIAVLCALVTPVLSLRRALRLVTLDR